MAITNNERVCKAMESLKTGLAPFASREFINHHKGQPVRVKQQNLGEPIQDRRQPFQQLGTAAQLASTANSWYW